MKNFVKHILAIAICAAALLSSCIKEENFKRDTVQLNVTLTRSSADSTQPGTGLEQGDKIEDVTLWAFSYTEVSNGFPVIADGATAVGYRYVNGITDTYGSIGIHVPLPTCNNTANYLIVAVINRSAFGSDFSLGQTSDWQTIREANFSANAKFWDVHPQDATPELMPVSNWAAFTINSGNVHEQNTNGTWKCYNLQLPVYRAVAKSQLYMAKTSNNFTLVVNEAKVVANNGYSNGAVLTASAEQSTGSNSEAIQRGKPSEGSTTWWWASPTAITRAEGATDPAVTYQLKNSESGFTPATIETLGSATNPESGNFTWVASTFLLENDNEADYGVGVYDEAQGEGYNLYVKYTVDGQEYEVYTPLGKVVRNHDYQVKATVDAGGEMALTIIVNEWTEDQEQVIDYQNSVTVETGDMLKWTSYTSYSNTTNVVPVVNGNIDFEGLNNGAAQCTFRLRTPVGGRWYAELVTISGDPDHFIFEKAEVTHTVDGASQTTTINGSNSTVISGDISDGLITLYIKTAKGNSATQNNATEDAVVELQISAKKTWGGRDRTYKVYGLTGLDNNANYTLTHKLGN